MYGCAGYATEIKRTMKSPLLQSRQRCQDAKVRTENFTDGTPIQQHT
jgi:hypothetical protein